MPTHESMRLPHPVDEAQVLIAIYNDDLAEAHREARSNYRRSEADAEAAFWFGVLQALTPNPRPQA